MCGPELSLESDDIELLSRALIDAFRDLDTLADALDPVLYSASGSDRREIRTLVPYPGRLQHQVPELLKYARSLGNPFTLRLLRGARRARPDNPALRKFLEGKLPMIVPPGRLGELAQLLSGRNLRDLRDLAQRAAPLDCALDVLSIQELLEALAEHPDALTPHPFLSFLVSAARSAEDGGATRRYVRDWIKEMFHGRRVAEAPLLARLEEPPWRERAVRAVCFYAAEDHEHLEDLEWLEELRADGRLDVWHTGPRPPDSRDEEVVERAATADLLLLFLSKAFLTSPEYERTVALIQRRAASARVVPIQLRPCRIERTQLAHFALIPAGGKAVLAHPDPGQAWAEVASALREIVEPHARRWRPVRVFFSHHAEDAACARELERALFPPLARSPLELVRDARWQSGEALRAGARYAEVILVLVSPHYVDSDELYRGELSSILEHGDRTGSVIIPILARDVNLAGTPLAVLQALPRDGPPLSRCRPGGDVRDPFLEELRSSIESIACSPGPSEPVRSGPSSRAVSVTSLSPVSVAVVAAAEDAVHRDALRRHLGFLRQQGIIEITCVDAGEPSERARTAGASIVIVLCSEALRRVVRDSDWPGWMAGARVVPVVLDGSDSVPPGLDRLVRLPEDDSAVADRGDADESWTMIGAKIAAVVAAHRGGIRPDGGAPSLFICAAGRDVAAQHELAKQLDHGVLRRTAPLPGSDLLEGPGTAMFIALLVSEDLFASSTCTRQMSRSLERHHAGEAIVFVVRLDRTPLPADLSALPVLPAADGALRELLPDQEARSPQREERWWMSLACEVAELTKLSHLLRPSAAR